MVMMEWGWYDDDVRIGWWYDEDAGIMILRGLRVYDGIMVWWWWWWWW